MPLDKPAQPVTLLHRQYILHLRPMTQDYDLKTLFGTGEGAKAMAKFLEATRAAMRPRQDPEEPPDPP